MFILPLPEYVSLIKICIRFVSRIEKTFMFNLTTARRFFFSVFSLPDIRKEVLYSDCERLPG